VDLLQTLACAFLAAALFERLGVPGGALVGAMVGVAALNLAGRHATTLPGGPQFVAFALLGWAIGQGVTRDTVGVLWRAGLPLLGVVAALVVFGGLVALAVTRLGFMDGTTAFLASCPGALSQMGALATSLGANAPLVAAAHTVRVIVVVLVSPHVARLVAGSG
jgi:membrane AbrB-like protein